MFITIFLPSLWGLIFLHDDGLRLFTFLFRCWYKSCCRVIIRTTFTIHLTLTLSEKKDGRKSRQPKSMCQHFLPSTQTLKGQQRADEWPFFVPYTLEHEASGFSCWQNLRILFLLPFLPGQKNKTTACLRASQKKKKTFHWLLLYKIDSIWGFSSWSQKMVSWSKKKEISKSLCAKKFCVKNISCDNNWGENFLFLHHHKRQ